MKVEKKPKNRSRFSILFKTVESDSVGTVKCGTMSHYRRASTANSTFFLATNASRRLYIGNYLSASVTSGRTGDSAALQRNQEHRFHSSATLSRLR